ncbi:ribosomal protection tetracycline resistance protein [Streptomyces griseochromogenes]|uniref:Ribosomal protection tetracycline resistance protein n=1 Tax=Streptomyces griseochromogenes TaxID=68214 RepID=A0ABS4LRS8_9ACTN|nr:GTP-binding protein [Streptomyces griseochromogenes]MBP2050107.1 ribosomal protection tetracycline resistance protein [Streptomyces griseochromogenes]
MHLLNLGILAHVDAGKTSLTERLLYTAGVTDELGSVDEGSTRTDTLALERRRGITIKSAVVSFPLRGVTVNLIDTPGHPDFIAEVERVLGVLDGAVLVVSAVEGVQAQTRILMRALRRLRIPTLIFVNKIDRRGARGEDVLREMARRLDVPLVPLGTPAGLGTRAARFVPGLGPSVLDVLAHHDDDLLRAYVDGGAAGVCDDRLRTALAARTRQALVHPVVFGSAITGAGVDELITGIERLLPRADGDQDGPLSGTVFKVERGPAGEKIAYARIYSGTLRVRDRIPFGDGHETLSGGGRETFSGPGCETPSEGGCGALSEGGCESAFGDGRETLSGCGRKSLSGPGCGCETPCEGGCESSSGDGRETLSGYGCETPSGRGCETPSGGGRDLLSRGGREKRGAGREDRGERLRARGFGRGDGGGGPKACRSGQEDGGAGRRMREPGRDKGEGRRQEGRVTALAVFDVGTELRQDGVGAGRIAKVWGLGGIRIGDALGMPGRACAHHFAPPTLETVVVPGSGTDRRSLHLALTQLAEQDPLIGVRHDELRGETSVSLYGEVQKEVVQATLAEEFGLDVGFRETTTLCVERPVGTGSAVEFNKKDPNPFLATVGLRVDPAPPGSGVRFRLEVELGSMPYAFFKAVEDTVRETLGQGLRGWQVTDCVITMTHSGYSPRQSHAHQGFDKSMSSTGYDFRGLTPLVLIEALRRAGTLVHEPMHRFRIEAPADTLGALLPVLVRLGAVPESADAQGPAGVLEGSVPVARVHELEQRLPGLTRGEGEMETAFDRYAPVTRGPAPERPRTDHNPLDRKEYLLNVTRRVGD